MLISPGTKPHNFTLSKSYREDLLSREVKWNIPGLSEFTFIRTYARKKPTGNLEVWNECVVRVIEGMFTILKTHAKINHITWDEKKAQKLAKEAADRMFCFKWLPPGRGLWMMGTDFVWERGGAALNNCFGGDMKFFDGSNLITFAENVDKEVSVWDVNGEPRTATVKSFGEQTVYDVEFVPFQSRSHFSMSFATTRDHGWILENGDITYSLAVGDKVRIDPLTPEVACQDFIDGFSHGFIFGDGSYNGSDGKYKIRLCGKKNTHHDYLSRSSFYRNTTYPASYDGDAYMYYDADIDLKSVPSNKNQSYIAGFVEGWLATDGHKKKNGSSYRLDTQNHEAAAWLVDHAFLTGYTVTGWGIENNDTNYGVRTAPLNCISLKRGSTVYRVRSMENPRKVPVYCVVEPETHSFRLAGGFPTRNCGFVSTEKMGESIEETVLPFTFLMDMSMLGVGIGFDTKGSLNNLRVLGYDQSAEPEVYVVEDTREGWVGLIGKVIENGFYGGPRVIADVSKVRGPGLPIRGFGGVSSGPEPLLMCAKGISDILDTRAKSESNVIVSTDIVDIQNIIGKCVVAGNVRRTAEIAFAEIDDEPYRNMKNWSSHPIETGNVAPDELKEISPEDYELYNANMWDTRNGIASGIVEKYREYPWSYKFGGWRWTSNNSVFARVGMNYKPFESSIRESGEPGFAWLDLMQRFGRMKDPENNKDHRVKGGNPCLEQSLESYELCCLVENFPSHHEDYWDFQRSLKFSYLYAKAVTLFGTHCDRTNSVIIRNRRIGCSMSGIVDAIVKFGRTHFMQEFCDKGYSYIDYVDRKYSEWLGIPCSIKKSSVKPSGSVSLVAGVFGPGIHYAKMKSGYRLIRVAKDSPLVEVLKAANYRVEPLGTDPLYTVVVYFPMLAPEGMLSEEDATIWEKFKMAADLQYWWADNQVSCTVEFTEDEGKRGEIARCLEAFDGQLKGISLLPKSEGLYAQMPYTSAPREEIEEYIKTLLPLDWRSLTNEGENAAANKYCDGDSCTL